jgi:hypothetical protein
MGPRTPAGFEDGPEVDGSNEPPEPTGGSVGELRGEGRVDPKGLLREKRDGVAGGSVGPLAVGGAGGVTTGFAGGVVGGGGGGVNAGG